MTPLFRSLLYSCILIVSGLLPFRRDAEGSEPHRPDDSSSPGLVLMCLSAHPDDEDGITLAYYGRLKGVKTYSIFFTRGEGGQNELGSELYEDLGAIRTSEALEAAAVLGSEVYFLGFPDFGFSKTAKETFAKWGGKDSVLARLVYFIRVLKPDVVITNHDTVTTKPNRGHGNHQAVGICAFEAFDKAADPAFHPEQLSDLVRPWQVKKLYFRVFRQDSATLRTSRVVDIDVSAHDSTGTAVNELALSALRKHRSQGLENLSFSSNPDFFRRHRFILMRSDQRHPFDAHDLFSGIKPSPRSVGILSRPTNDIPPFSIRVSPQYVPRSGSGTFAVMLADRRSRRFDACSLSVVNGAREIFRRRYGPGAAIRTDTLRLAFDRDAGASDSALRFQAIAMTGDESISAEFTVWRKPVPATMTPGARVGLVRTYDNTSEETLNSLGIPYRLIDSVQLKGGDLDLYTAILLDLRAYAFRTEAAANNKGLLEFVRKGGNVICFYHKPGDWNGKHFSPFPILLTAERVTQEEAPVRMLQPHHQLLTEPNTITEADWDGWVQERSVYLPSRDTVETSAMYERILSMSDEDEDQPPTSLLWARYGGGSYTYVSLALYRQLRILQTGAVKLFLNMISQPRH